MLAPSLLPGWSGRKEMHCSSALNSGKQMDSSCAPARRQEQVACNSMAVERIEAKKMG